MCFWAKKTRNSNQPRLGRRSRVDLSCLLYYKSWGLTPMMISFDFDGVLSSLVLGRTWEKTKAAKRPVPVVTPVVPAGADVAGVPARIIGGHA